MASPGNRHCANCIGSLSFHARTGWDLRRRNPGVLPSETHPRVVTVVSHCVENGTCFLETSVKINTGYSVYTTVFVVASAVINKEKCSKSKNSYVN